MSSEPARLVSLTADGETASAAVTRVVHWRRCEASRSVRAQPWSSALEAPAAAELLLRTLEPLARATLEALPRGLLPAVEKALAGDWLPLRQELPGLTLRVEYPVGEFQNASIAEASLRIGSAESCQIRLAAPEIAAEACELQRLAEGWRIVCLDAESRILLNGSTIEPHVSHPVVAGEFLDFGEARVALVAEEIVPAVSPRARLRDLSRVRTGDPFSALGGDDRWSLVRVGDWRGYLRVPGPWIVGAYHVLGYEPPAQAMGWHNPVDSSLTGFALRRLASQVAETTGAEVEVGEPLPATELGAILTAEGEGWLAAHFELQGLGLSSVVVWPTAWARSRAARRRAARLHGIPFHVSVLAGHATLPLAELAALEPGDVVLPDAWMPRRQRDDRFTGDVLLRTQHWVRRAVLEPDRGRPRLELRSRVWRDVREEEMSMNETPETESETGSADEQQSVPLVDLANELEVLLSFELDRIVVPLQELAEWDEGTTIELERSPDGPVRVLLHHAGGSRVVGRGRVVVVENRLGVQLEDWRPGNVGPGGT